LILTSRGNTAGNHGTSRFRTEGNL
jgi:hypothetical protein